MQFAVGITPSKHDKNRERWDYKLIYIYDF